MSTPSFRPTPETMEDFLDSGMVKVEHPAQSNCDICLEKFALSDYAVQIHGINGCWHIFGRSCITTWLYTHSTCPVCRVKLHGSHRPAFVASLPEELQEREPRRLPLVVTPVSHWTGLGEAESPFSDALPSSGPIPYTEEAFPRRQPQDFMPDLSQEAQPGSRYPTYGRAISPPLSPAARQQRRHRIMVQLRVARETREHYEGELQNSDRNERSLMQRISEALTWEARLMAELEQVPAVAVAEPAPRRIVAQFSMTVRNVQEEDSSRIRPKSRFRVILRKMGEKFGYRP